jgi:putative phosphoesterase
MTPQLFGLLSDTHGYVHPALFGAFEGVQTILHAGDVCGDHVLQELECIAPVQAVRGNCDAPDPLLPEIRRVELPGGIAILTHGHLQDGATTDPVRFVRAFAANRPRLILFGHSHRWFCEQLEGIWVVNPGAAGRPRFMDKPSAAVLVCEADRWRIRRVDLPWPTVEVRR